MRPPKKNKDIVMHKTAINIKNSIAGITLVALVITIIVLLILAGITVVSLTGDNGIIKKAQEAKNKTEQAEKTEQEGLNNLLDTVNQIQGGSTGGGTKPIIPTPAGTPLPTGFVYVGGTIEEGVVISDNTADEGKGISHDIAQTLQGNQFVWVPVETPIANSEADLTTLLAEGKLPMAVKQTDGNYRGVLYDIDTTGKFTAKSYGLNVKYREPDVVTDNNTGDGTKFDGAPENLAKIGVSDLESFRNQLKSEYKKIVESVIANKGFYVGRYETSMTIDKKVESKAGKDAMNADSSSGDMWYGMYAKSKQLSSNSNGITTGMIWGSQWDQMMVYMKEVRNIKDSTKLFICDSTEMGNYTGSKLKTGSNANYRIKSVYDIAGNYWDWTMEAYNINYRVVRGGVYSYAGAKYPSSSNLSSYPTSEIRILFLSSYDLYIKFYFEKSNIIEMYRMF